MFILTLATSCEELTHWKRLWCWEGLGAGGEGDSRGWDGWMASRTWCTWVWVNSRSWWWTGRPGVLRFMGLQRVVHDWVTELNWTELKTTLVEVYFTDIQTNTLILTCFILFSAKCIRKIANKLMLTFLINIIRFQTKSAFVGRWTFDENWGKGPKLLQKPLKLLPSHSGLIWLEGCFCF